MQLITFNEYVPAVTGRALPVYRGYNSSANPSIDPFFAVAAFRYGHSAINSVYMRLEEDGTDFAGGHLLLRDWFFNPEYLLHGGSPNSATPPGIDVIIRGLIAHPESLIDVAMVEDLRNFVRLCVCMCACVCVCVCVYVSMYE
jgi:peroxidase